MAQIVVHRTEGKRRSSSAIQPRSLAIGSSTQSVRDAPRNKLFVVVLCLLLLSVTLTNYSSRHPALSRWGASFMSDMLLPLQQFSAAVRQSFATVWHQYIGLVNVERENVLLRQRVRAVETDRVRLKELEYENQKLRTLLSMREANGFQGVAAQVVAYDPSNWVEAITINVGYESGVLEGMAVLVGNGVVGHVVSSVHGSSSVLLITDRSSSVDAFLQGSRVRGIVEGGGDFRAHWNYVLADAEVQVGERVLTSGLDGVYPKGALVGVIVAVEEAVPGRLFRAIEIRSEVDFSRLENVFVVTQRAEGAS